MTPTPSPELRALIREWVDIQRAKYGPDWKEKLAAEMTETTMRALGRGRGN